MQRRDQGETEVTGVRRITGTFVTHLPAQPEHGWLYDYQTLLTGILAFGAAAIAAFIAHGQLKAARLQIASNKEQVEAQIAAARAQADTQIAAAKEQADAQIAAVKEQADADRTARLRAVRASLPATLSAWCDYAQQVAQSLYNSWPHGARQYPNDVREHEFFDIRADLPILPPELIPPLERLMEVIDNEPVAERVESILREAQMLAARTRHFDQPQRLTLNDLSERILQAAALYARVESLFGYARRQKPSIDEENLWERTIAAVFLMGIYEDRVGDLGRQQRDAGLPPGEADTVL